MEFVRKFEELQSDGRFSRQQMISGWSQERLSEGRVLVVGAGALGNETLKNLALLGVGTIGVIDFDWVEESNLSRCVLFRAEDIGRAKVEVATERLKELNPAVQVHAYRRDLLTEVGAGLLEEYDLVLGDVDSIVARWQLNRLARRAGVRWIDAGVDAFCGQIAVYDPAVGACYECGLSEQMWDRIFERHSCTGIARDVSAEAIIPVSVTVVSLTAALQAQEAIQFLMRWNAAQDSGDVQPGERLSVRIAPYECFVLRSSIRASCLAHAETRGKARALAVTKQATVEELLNRAEADLLHLDWEIVDSLNCNQCGNSEVAFPLWHLNREQVRCPLCGQERFANRVSKISLSDLLAHCSLEQLGVPDKAHLRFSVENQAGEFWGRII